MFVSLTNSLPGVQDSDMQVGVDVTDQIYAVFGRLVRTRREELRMTQSDLSTRIGLSRASVANIEGGRQAVLLHQLIALADALSLPAMDLIPSMQPKNEPPNLPEEVKKFMLTYKLRTRADRQ
jgi:transcriptional regulator with XRE-family HTH domain